MKSLQQTQQQSNEVQVTEHSQQQQQQQQQERQKQVVEQPNHQDLPDNSYDNQNDFEDLLVSILDEMIVIKKMITEQTTHRIEGKYDNYNNTHNNKTTKPAVEAEKQVERISNLNAHDFSDCF
jgi:hypothetical protein